jgi:hypothetical protein
MLREDWPEFEKAIDSEFENVRSHDSYVLVDKEEVFNQGAYISYSDCACEKANREI